MLYSENTRTTPAPLLPPARYHISPSQLLITDLLIDLRNPLLF